MITCPECGLQANDDARFCDRCGHGFAQAVSRKPAPSIAPLAEGTELKHGFRIVQLDALQIERPIEKMDVTVGEARQ